MPATPTVLTLNSQWIPWRVNNAISNKAAGDFSFTSAEVGQHRAQALVGSTVVAETVLGDAIRTFQLFGIPLGGAATIQVRSENAGLSGWKTLAFAAPAMPTTAGSISVPSGLAADVSNPAQVTFSWTDNANNEDRIHLLIRGPNGVTLDYYRDAPATTFVAPLRPVIYAQSNALLFGTNYVVQIAAQGGKYKTRGMVLLETALSAEVEFTTAAAQIVITNLPGAVPAWQGLAFTFEMLTTEVATSYALSSGAFPTGVTLNTGTGVVSGTPTAAPGTYIVALRANNAGGHDIQTLTIQLAIPSFQIKRTDLTPLSVINGSLSVAVDVQLLGVPFGPIAAVTTWVLTEAPDWLSFVGDHLQGTPDASGVYLCALTASNGPQTTPWTFTIVVAGVRITTAASLTVFAEAAFSFPLAAVPLGCEFTSGDLPAGTTLVGNIFAGTVAVAGDVEIDFGAHVGVEGDTQAFTLHVLPLFASDSEWDMTLGQPQLELLTYNGSESVEKWFLSSAPPGLVIDYANALTGPSSETRKAKVTGAPTATGIFDAEVTAQTLSTGLVSSLQRFPVRIVVSGGLFLGWFHIDPALREIQYLIRSRDVMGYYFDADAGLVLVRGDAITLNVILRDAPIHPSEFGLRTVESGLTDLKLMVRPSNDYDGEPWIEAGGAVTTAAIGTHTVFTLALTATSDGIEKRFRAINESEGADPTESKIEGLGELTGTLNGVIFTSKPFRVTVVQDIER